MFDVKLVKFGFACNLHLGYILMFLACAFNFNPCSLILIERKKKSFSQVRKQTSFFYLEFARIARN